MSRAATPPALVSLPPETGARGPLYLRICDRLRARIGAGEIAPGTRLPSSRALAADLGVSRTTVVAAYDQLIAEGYAQSRPGAGVFACDVCAVPEAVPEATPGPGFGPTPGAGGSTAIRADRPARNAPDARPLVPAPPSPPPSPPPPLPLTPGLADLALFPVKSWARTVARVARREAHALHHCPDPRGDGELRRQIVRHLLDWRGVRAHPDQVVITAGSGEALERALELVAAKGPVGLEDPGYPPTCRHVAARGWPIRWLDLDSEGARPPGCGGAPAPAEARAEAKAPAGAKARAGAKAQERDRAGVGAGTGAGTGAGVVVLTPSHQFPMGGSMSPARRAAFIDWARTTGGWIIEDDFDSEFRYAGRPLPALAALAHGGRVIYVGSFSKVFSHGLRLGYMVLPDALADAAQEMLADAPSRAAVGGQRALARFMEDGGYLRHLRRARRVYARRYAVLMRAMETWLTGLGEWQRQNAGMLQTCRLPETRADQEVAAAARRAGVGCLALSRYAVRPGVANGLVLGFCATPEHEIAEAVRRISRAVRETQPAGGRSP